MAKSTKPAGSSKAAPAKSEKAPAKASKAAKPAPAKAAKAPAKAAKAPAKAAKAPAKAPAKAAKAPAKAAKAPAKAAKAPAKAPAKAAKAPAKAGGKGHIMELLEGPVFIRETAGGAVKMIGMRRTIGAQIFEWYGQKEGFWLGGAVGVQVTRYFTRQTDIPAIQDFAAFQAWAEPKLPAGNKQWWSHVVTDEGVTNVAEKPKKGSGRKGGRSR